MAMRIHSLPYVIQILTRIIASLVIMLLMSTVHGRILSLNSSDDLISDGIDGVDDQSVALTANDVLVSASACHHTYGFLPCAENAGGYIFQILVYQGLLIFGEMQLGTGSKNFFNILENYFGTSKFVSIIFRILMELPAMMMMILSGVFGSKETARSLVSIGVGIYAGITVFTLTLQWGICLIFGAKKSPDKSKTSEHSESQTSCCLQVKDKFNELKDTSVKLRNETRHVAGLMLLSLIPYIIVQLIDIFKTSHIFLLIAFIVSATSLILYFIYQTLDEWMQKLSSDYMQYEILREAFLKHVERWGKLVDEDDGNPNSALIKILFRETDKDGDGYITGPEMQKLFNKIMPGMSEETINRAVDKSMKLFDSDKDGKINQTEFTRACVTLAEKGDFFSTELQDENFQQFSRMEKEKLEIDPIMSKILKHAESQLLEGSLIQEDGKPNIERINTLFRKYDNDNNNKISRNELEEIINTVQFENLHPKSEDVVNKIFFNFDKDGSNMIEKEEFVNGLQNWLAKAVRVAKCSDKTKSVDKFDRIVWDKFVYRQSYWNFVTCVFRIVLGIVILTFIGGPLTTSILQLSYAMSVPSFSISFVIVPLAMNARILIEAIFPVSKKTEKTASLTFSEIYSSVVMNNISGLTTLLAVVYAKDLPWDYSAEVLTILVVCAIVGILGVSRTEYPFWTCLLAFFLYPFSLGLYCFVELVLHWN
ncbi:sodium calcium exchanger NCL-like [Olea europaea subsp. europaea]|uniref:Sodium calcium exchanger NCL-like n=1 Tax=Olea europaea subsp. europaea TaxID=158383 RepID=A0A8S0UJ10_OLEEU|nr:sodium calcium exchanger NCL-like [Olea europaea subsp. europaea]